MIFNKCSLKRVQKWKQINYVPHYLVISFLLQKHFSLGCKHLQAWRGNITSFPTRDKKKEEFLWKGINKVCRILLFLPSS